MKNKMQRNIIEDMLNFFEMAKILEIKMKLQTKKN